MNDVEEDVCSPPCKKTRAQRCILHRTDVEHGKFIPFSRIKGCTPQERLTFLQDVKTKRLAQPHDSQLRMKDICDKIPLRITDIDIEITGYHNACYQRFTKNMDRLVSSSKSYEQQPSTSKRSPRKRSVPDFLYPPTCIFCEKIQIQKNRKTERCTTFPKFAGPSGQLKEPAWKKIEHQALDLNNMALYRCVQGQDLFAREAKYHPSCLAAFKLEHLAHTRKKLVSNDESAKQDKLKDAHRKAFDVILAFIYKHIVEQKEVVLLTSLHKIYVQELEIQGVKTDYRSEKLKSRLENHEVGQHLAFAKVDPGTTGFIKYNLIYNSSISTSDAVVQAFELGSKDRIMETARLIRGLIQKAFSDATPLAWPPTADDLDTTSMEKQLPPDLLKFLSFVVSGSADVDKCETTKRVILSIGQVMCNTFCIYFFTFLKIFLFLTMNSIL